MKLSQYVVVLSKYNAFLLSTIHFQHISICEYGFIDSLASTFINVCDHKWPLHMLCSGPLTPPPNTIFVVYQ